MERLDKIVSNLGYGSRKEVKALVKKGLIEVDGVVVKDNGMAIDPETAVIRINGEEITYRKCELWTEICPTAVLRSFLKKSEVGTSVFCERKEWFKAWDL